MKIQSISQTPFSGNIKLNENGKKSLFVQSYSFDDWKVIDELEEMGNFSDRGYDFNDDNCYIKDIILDTDNIRAIHKFNNGYYNYSSILYFLPKTQTNVDVVLFGDANSYDSLANAYNKVNGTSLNTEV